MLGQTISVSVISQMVLLIPSKKLFSLTLIVNNLILDVSEVLAATVLMLWLAGLMELPLL